MAWADLSGRVTAAGPDRPPRPGHIPGEVGVWVLILGDMTMFAVFFALYSQARAADVALFDRSQARLSTGIGLANTLLLLASSFFVARGVHRVRGGGEGSACFALAMLCGAGFGVDKVLEYGEKLSAGITPVSNDFFMYYFVLTGVHALHLVIGMFVLAYLWRATRRATSRPSVAVVEGCASYWHLVDILWIVLFPLLYLL
jgi:nitric oxide reductase NorE protein